MKTRKPYLYLAGLKKLAKETLGTETVHVGIRPYGFHGGNVMALVIYPMLLCEFTEKAGKKARFKFIVSINDWEQDVLSGPDPRKYPFNVFPGKTILKYTPDDQGCCESVVDHWEPVIKKCVNSIRKKNPDVSIQFIRNSKMRRPKFSKELLWETLTDPYKQFEIYTKVPGKEFLQRPILYAAPVCPTCKTAVRNYSVAGTHKLKLACAVCDAGGSYPIAELDFWWYHKPLLLARMNAFKIDITISGGDHFSEGDFMIRRELIKEYCPHLKEPRMLFTPLVVLPNGEKMSKSRNNALFVDAATVLAQSRNNFCDTFTVVPSIISQNQNEQDYRCIF